MSLLVCTFCCRRNRRATGRYATAPSSLCRACGRFRVSLGPQQERSCDREVRKWQEPAAGALPCEGRRHGQASVASRARIGGVEYRDAGRQRATCRVCAKAVTSFSLPACSRQQRPRFLVHLHGRQYDAARHAAPLSIDGTDQSPPAAPVAKRSSSWAATR